MRNYEIVSKPTWFRGEVFRSKLEARWACFFYHLGVKYWYEPEVVYLRKMDVSYLPDFWLPTVQMWAEVKPTDFVLREEQKLRHLTRQTGFSSLLLEGRPLEGLPYRFFSSGDHSECDCFLDDEYTEVEGRFFVCTGQSHPSPPLEMRQVDLGRVGISYRTETAYILANSVDFDKSDWI